MENLDQLVRLNIGDIPVEAAYPDYACVQGYVLYKVLRTSGDCRFITVRLDTRLIASIHAPGLDGAFSLYRDPDGRITPVARFIGLCCLEHDVPVRLISRQLGVAESTVRRWRRERRRLAGVVTDQDPLASLRTLAFRGKEEE